MADLALTAAQISVVDPEDATIFSGVLASTVTKGQTVYQNTSGTWAAGDGSGATTTKNPGIALEGGGAGQAVSILTDGLVAGFTITQAYGAAVYLSDTAGALADAAGTVSVVMGTVFGLSDSSYTKVLRIKAVWG